MNKQFFTLRDSEVRLFVILAIALSFLFAVSFIFGSRIQRRDNSVPTETAFKAFLPVNLKAKAVYVYDIRTKTVLFAKNENVRLPLASLTKIMSALVARDISPLYSTVIITSDALAAE